MAFNTSKRKPAPFLFRLKEAYKEGLAGQLKKSYKRFQYQQPLTYEAPKGVNVRQFEHKQDAIAFENSISKKYSHVQTKRDFLFFVGVPCDTPEQMHIVYYSKKPFKLTENTKNSLVPKLVKSTKYSPDSVQCMGFSNLTRDFLSPKRYSKNPQV